MYSDLYKSLIETMNNERQIYLIMPNCLEDKMGKHSCLSWDLVKKLFFNRKKFGSKLIK